MRVADRMARCRIINRVTQRNPKSKEKKMTKQRMKEHLDINQLTHENVARRLKARLWIDDDELSYALIEQLDQKRVDGSKITTAMELIRQMVIIGRENSEPWEFSPALTLVLEWLYYGMTGSK